MRNKRFAALAMAAIMVASSAMPVMADTTVEIETEESISNPDDESNADDEEKTSSGIEATDGEEVHETGDVDTSGTSDPGISADDSTVTVDGNVTGGYNGIEAAGSDITVGGNVTAENGYGIAADYSDVTVGGNVTGVDGGIGASESTVKVDGNVNGNGIGIDADLGSDIMVKGDVTSKETGIIVSRESDVEVGGNVTAGDGFIGIDASESANIIVGGNVTGGDGVYAEGSNVSIKGSVKANAEDGIGIIISGTEKTTVIVEGDVSANDAAIDVADNENASSEVVVAGKVSGADGAIINVTVDDETGKVNTLPEIVVGEITDFDKITVKDFYKKEAVSEDVKKEVLDSIKYIVGTNDASMDGKGTISITKVNGSALDKDGLGRFDVAKASETITVHINVQDGYEVSEVRAGKATLTRNADGTYSVTVPAGGGVNIEALIKAIEKSNSNVENNTNNNSDGSDYSVYTEQVTSTWDANGDSWTYTKADGTKAQNEWQQITYNGKQHWYYFGADKNMSTGLFTDAQGHQYYLNPVAGELRGTMVTGWVEIDGKWMFFNDGTVADLPEGCLVEGMVK